ncbi:MAG TPA: multidrug effflux MFS transporter [Alphaproteobacteria bacterium]|jgi:DHA1 family bicyclomycin/chloramphenicol resistance-like MFS transporter|nr:multidrug effflux MFS transporter [Alphaproteobacteria bacterium]MDP6269245.1 multidrug effflux MFS transporter [Alphaproteobacteria bacterium]MDP7163793.1 multidrug effflux MFS transporter [Alphaproteobacteria bacterium]MDP7428119.1 multidrug effflux MFS transporter [Alphaproteobacteria bacterium]HJM49015.1 multidrug effflux MFS transporter [Alphaproteobacteria bacterium]
MTLSRGQLIALLASLVAVGMVATNIYVPSLPALTRDLGTTPRMVQLTLTVYFAAVALTQLAYGPISDRIGRRPVVLAGIGLYIVASLGCMLAPSIEVLIGARVLQAMGACAGPVMARAIIRDVFEREESARVMATIGLVLAISPAVAPVLGSHLQVWFGWRSVFAAVAAFGTVVMIVMLRFLGETRPPGLAPPSSLMAGYRTLLASPAYLGYALSSTCVLAGLFAFITEAPFIIIELLGEPAQNFGWYSLITVGGFALGSYAASRLSLRLGIDRMVALGIAAALLGAGLLAGLALAGVFSVAAVIVPMAVVASGMGMVFPNTTAGAVGAFPHIAGTASALLGFLQMSGAALATLLVAWVADGTQVPMTLAVLGFILGAAAAYVWGQARQR